MFGNENQNPSPDDVARMDQEFERLGTAAALRGWVLPKTRSGKIMRCVLKAITVGTDPGDITTIEDEGSVEDARKAWSAMREQLNDGP